MSNPIPGKQFSISKVDPSAPGDCYEIEVLGTLSPEQQKVVEKIITQSAHAVNQSSEPGRFTLGYNSSEDRDRVFGLMRRNLFGCHVLDRQCKAVRSGNDEGSLFFITFPGGSYPDAQGNLRLPEDLAHFIEEQEGAKLKFEKVGGDVTLEYTSEKARDDAFQLFQSRFRGINQRPLQPTDEDVQPVVVQVDVETVSASSGVSSGEEGEWIEVPGRLPDLVAKQCGEQIAVAFKELFVLFNNGNKQAIAISARGSIETILAQAEALGWLGVVTQCQGILKHTDTPPEEGEVVVLLNRVAEAIAQEMPEVLEVLREGNVDPFKDSIYADRAWSIALQQSQQRASIMINRALLGLPKELAISYRMLVKNIEKFSGSTWENLKERLEVLLDGNDPINNLVKEVDQNPKERTRRLIELLTHFINRFLITKEGLGLLRTDIERDREMIRKNYQEKTFGKDLLTPALIAIDVLKKRMRS